MNEFNAELIKKNRSVQDFRYKVNNDIKITATTFADIGSLI